jgi:hypothetical protein
MTQFKKVVGVPGLENLLFLSCESDIEETIIKLGRLSSVLKKVFLFK